MGTLITLGKLEAISETNSVADPPDTTAPVVTLSNVSGMANHVAGHVLSGSIGPADGGLTVTIRDNGDVIGTVTSDREGRFSFAFTDIDGTARHEAYLMASATDAAGNSGNSDLFTYKFDYVPNADLFGSVIHSFDSPAGEIYALYDGLLGRPPDLEGFAAYMAALNSGTSLHDLAQHMLDSPEYRAHFSGYTPGDGELVDDLYRVALYRRPDPQGGADWLNALADGESRADVALSFVLSAEKRALEDPSHGDGIFVPSAAATKVARFYYALLDRAPDAPGLDDWQKAYGAGRSLESIAQGFLDSPERRTTFGDPTDQAFITGVYQGAMGHAPDVGGLQHYEEQLNAGASRAAVAVSITEIPEAQYHLLPVIQNGFHLV